MTGRLFHAMPLLLAVMMFIVWMRGSTLARAIDGHYPLSSMLIESAVVFAGAWSATLAARRRLASAVIGRTTTHSAACARASSSVPCVTSTTTRMTQ